MRTEIAKPALLRPLIVLAVLAFLGALAAFAAPLAADEGLEGGSELGVFPAQPYDNEPVTLLFSVLVSSQCYSGEGLSRHGNTFDLELGGCPFLPPPGPFRVELDADIGRLEPGTYLIRYLFNSEEVETFEFTVREALGTCAPDADVLCLGDRRFEVRATWQANGQEGVGQAAAITRDTGRLSFFSPGNIELVVKVLDACALDGRFWVFAGGLTNVRVGLTVKDTTTGAVRTYENPAGTAFAPILDTTAFACP